MYKAQRAGMQCQTVYGRGLGAVATVTGNGRAHVVHVYAYLIFASGVKADVHQRVSVAAFEDLVSCHGFQTLGVIGAVH